MGLVILTTPPPDYTPFGVCTCICLSGLRVILFNDMTFDLDIWHAGSYCQYHAKFAGQGHRSNFEVTRKKFSGGKHFSYAYTLWRNTKARSAETLNRKL